MWKIEINKHFKLYVRIDYREEFVININSNSEVKINLNY